MAFDRTIELGVTGLTCAHCVSHVTEELEELDPVVNVSVTLVKDGVSKVLVYTNEDIDDAVLRQAIDEAGDYELQSVVR
ncbi:MAG: heavy-metal-associated domain-containing protein [Actinomycetaceae bacterium]|nr:heavy-metal-associated domain-containing protein [Actinomycetaceae bacterium]